MRVPVTFEPDGIVVLVEQGSTVLEAARSAGVSVPAPCGGRGICGTCGVRVTVGTLAEAGPTERISLARAPEDVRLACCARVEGPVSVRPILFAPTEESSFG